MSRRRWNISREGDSTASLGSLGQGSITLRGKKFFLGFSWNFLCIQEPGGMELPPDTGEVSVGSRPAASDRCSAPVPTISSFQLLSASGVCSLRDGWNSGKLKSKKLYSLSWRSRGFHPQPLPGQCSSRQTRQPSTEPPLIPASTEKEKVCFEKTQVRKV